jgi:REP element-mobilizing transposase RayT
MARAEAREADVTSDNATVKRGGTGFQPVKHGQDDHASSSGTGFQPVKHGQDDHASSSGTGFQPVKHGQDDHAAINIRHGAYLPHWTKDTSIYSVTFRLADSLPKAVVEAWAAEREIIIQTAKQMNRPLTQDEEKRLQFLFSEKVDSYMDAGHGACHMKKPAVAQIVTNTLRHFDGQRYRLLAWCVMPNHVHVVFEPLPDCDLSNILHSWKSFSANLANSTLKRKGEFWQPEYFDHLIRDEADLSHSIEYVLGNPEKAGLKNWKWVSDKRESD